MPGDAGVTPGVMTYTFDRVTDSGTRKITKSVPYNPKQTSTTKSQTTSTTANRHIRSSTRNTVEIARISKEIDQLTQHRTQMNQAYRDIVAKVVLI
jgi:hypothetical protein